LRSSINKAELGRLSSHQKLASCIQKIKSDGSTGAHVHKTFSASNLLSRRIEMAAKFPLLLFFFAGKFPLLLVAVLAILLRVSPDVAHAAGGLQTNFVELSVANNLMLLVN
jgi:hypothetical protein